jgi:hypothetical protein
MPPRNSSDQPYLEQPHAADPHLNGTHLDATRVTRQPDEPAAVRAPMSRRFVLRGAAGVGAVAAAAAAGAGAVVAFDRPAQAATLMPVSKPVKMAPMAPTAMAGPLIVYIADTTTGVLDVFGGTGATQVVNPALVRQLLANLKLA